MMANDVPRVDKFASGETVTQLLEEAGCVIIENAHSDGDMLQPTGYRSPRPGDGRAARERRGWPTEGAHEDSEHALGAGGVKGGTKRGIDQGQLPFTDANEGAERAVAVIFGLEGTEGRLELPKLTPEDGRVREAAAREDGGDGARHF